MDRIYRSNSIGQLSSNEQEVKAWQHRLNELGRLLWNKIKGNFIAIFTIKNTANAAFIITITTLCLQQCYSQINEYTEYETRVQVSHTFPKSILWLIPGVTVCNNNRVRMARLTKETFILEERLRRLMINKTSSLYQEKKRIELMAKIKEIVDETVNITSLLNDSPVPKLLELSRTSMVRDINCNNLWGRPFNCENFRIIESFQGGPCYTMFYQGALLEALATGSAYDFNTSLLPYAQKKLDSFASNEIVEIIVDLEPFEHADFQYDVGGKVVIHSTGHVGSVRDMAHSILPGYSYDLIIRRQISKRLPPPYQSRCYDYKTRNSHHFTKREGSIASVELDKTTCVRNCISRQTTKACNCWPIEVPYYLGDNVVENSENYKLCEWGTEELQKNHTSKLYLDCFKKYQAGCIANCSIGCSTENYQVHVMSRRWPTKETFFLTKTSAERDELRRLRMCCAKISLKYHEFMENRHVQYPSMTLAQLVSNIGGIVSACIGLSVIAFYRYVTRKILHCKTVSEYDPSMKDKRLKRHVARVRPFI